MKRIILTVAILAMATQTATAQTRDAYGESYKSMLGMERAMNQGALELQQMKDARQSAIAAAEQRAAQKEAMELQRQSLNTLKGAKRADRKQLIRERALRAKATGSAEKTPGGI